MADEVKEAGTESAEEPFAFPEIRRRVIGAVGLILSGIALLAGGLFWTAPAYNSGFWLSGVLITLLGVYFALSSWKLEVTEADAIEIAASAFGFAMGPASVSIGWRGFRSRPIWRILAYSHEAPPKMRGLALIDAVDGVVLSKIEEENPEDWSDAADEAKQ